MVRNEKGTQKWYKNTGTVQRFEKRYGECSQSTFHLSACSLTCSIELESAKNDNKHESPIVPSFRL